MFASKLKKRLKRLARLVPVRRFVHRDDGAVAVEFGLVMLPFLTLMFVIAETALVFFAGQTLETAAADSARLIMTGQAQTHRSSTPARSRMPSARGSTACSTAPPACMST